VFQPHLSGATGVSPAPRTTLVVRGAHLASWTRLPASRPRSGPSPHPRSAAAAAAAALEPPGRPGHPPVPPSPTQMDLAGPSCPLWSLWPASARSSAHRSTRAGHHEHVVRLQRAGWGGGAGSSSRGHRPRARATTSRPLRWTGPSRLQPAQTPRRGPFSSRFVPSSACPASVGTLERADSPIRAPHPTRQMGGLLAKAPMAAYTAPMAQLQAVGPRGVGGDT